MLDRLSFLVSRGLGPASNLAILTVVGLAFGVPGVADYTFALVVCGPLYYLVGFALQTYIAVQPFEAASRREILWVRLLTVGASCVVAALAALIGGERWHVTAALWLLKAGEVLFEPVVVFAAIDASSSSRGRKLALIETTRVVVVQALLWSFALVVKTPLAVTLAVVGLGGVLVGGYFLVAFPKWTGPSYTREGIVASLRRIAVSCTPMAASGALLATLIGLPRLLMDHQLSQEERTLIGIAQVGGSVIGMVFNAIWMYDLHKLKSACSEMIFARIVTRNLFLTLVYCLILGGMAVAAWCAILLVEPWAEFFENKSGVIVYLFVILSLPHCVSLHRDVLKLVGQFWTEVLVLMGALLSGCATWYLCDKYMNLNWLEMITSLVVVMSLYQLTVSTLALLKITKASIAS